MKAPHPIQSQILKRLVKESHLRFSELKPKRVDTNLFTYHLKRLVAAGLIEKSASSYTLSTQGLTRIDSFMTQGEVAPTPKTMIMLVIQNEEGDILLSKRQKQPYVATWTLPHGSLHLADQSVHAAAQRCVFEKLGLENPELEHAGVATIYVRRNGEPLTTTLVQVFRGYFEYTPLDDTMQWARPHKLTQLPLAPAVEAIMTRTFFKDPFYYEEFYESWDDSPQSSEPKS